MLNFLARAPALSYNADISRNNRCRAAFPRQRSFFESENRAELLFKLERRLV